MSTFKCTCGRLISDVKYPADFDYVVLQQRSYDSLLRALGVRLAEFVQSVSKSDWINSEFGPDYPKDAEIGEVAEDLLTRELTSSSQHMFRCESCQRLYLQRHNEPDSYDRFVPEQSSHY